MKMTVDLCYFPHTSSPPLSTTTTNPSWMGPLCILYLTIRLLTALLWWQLRESYTGNYSENSAVKNVPCRCLSRNGPWPHVFRDVLLSHAPLREMVWAQNDNMLRCKTQFCTNNFFWEIMSLSGECQWRFKDGFFFRSCFKLIINGSCPFDSSFIWGGSWLNTNHKGKLILLVINFDFASWQLLHPIIRVVLI